VATGAASGSTNHGDDGTLGPEPMFRGVTELTLDAKGRLAIPARHRDVVLGYGDGRLILTGDPSRCLLLYPYAVWKPIEARLMALSAFNEKVRSLQRLLVGYADDVDIDGSGRILVPPSLRAFARLDKEVVLVGQGHRFELWGEAEWKAQTAQAIAFGTGGFPPELDGFSL
jgi:MraZ protein